MKTNCTKTTHFNRVRGFFYLEITRVKLII